MDDVLEKVSLWKKQWQTLFLLTGFCSRFRVTAGKDCSATLESYISGWEMKCLDC